jgi:ABC-type multidrug transport system fused ATPase/permease subunit
MRLLANNNMTDLCLFSVLFLLPNIILLAFAIYSAFEKGILIKKYGLLSKPGRLPRAGEADQKSNVVKTTTLLSDNTETPDFDLYLPKENHLWRYKFLLVLKVATAITGAALYVTAAGLSAQSNAGGSNVFGCTVCGLGMLVAAYSSWRQHRSTWRPSMTIQMYALMMIFVHSIRLRTEWTRADRTNNNLAILLSVNLVILVFWCILESLPRLTKDLKRQLNLAPDLTANIFSLMTFQYVQPLLSKGYRLHKKGQDMDVEILYPLRPQLISERLGDSLLKEWHRQTRKKGSAKMAIAFLRLYVPAMLVPSGVWLMYTATQYANPMLLNGFLSWIATYATDSPSPLRLGIEFAFGMCGITVVLSICFGVCVFYINQSLMAFRGALISSVYRKSLRLSPEEFSKRSIGDISNHVTVDAESLVDGDLAILFIIGLPMSMALGIYFLYVQLSWAVFPGLAWFLLICFGIQSRIGQQFGRAMKFRLKYMDERVSMVNETVSGIKFVKLNAWEKPFMQRILKIREMELKGLLMRAKAFSIMITTTQLSKNCTPAIMFWVYVMVVAKEDQGLDANRVFVSLVITNMISSNIETLSFSLGWLYTVISSMKRIQKFLNADELIEDDEKQAATNDSVKNTTEKVSADLSQELDKQTKITIRDGVFTWTKDIAEAKFKLQVPELKIYDNEFVAVVGRIGAGKSSILSAILKNMYCHNGKVLMDQHPVAYCSQSPFIMNATVEDNIVFGRPFDTQALEDCIYACALDKDIEMLPGGLNTEIGERGIGLSGGQKARVALARACYAVRIGYASIVMLDDVLSAVDVHTEQHLFDHVLNNETGLLKHTTRILVTHAVHYMDQVDRIIYLDEGDASQIGTHDELMKKEGHYQTLITEFARMKTTQKKKDNEDSEEIEESKEIASQKKDDREKGALTSEEVMKTGRVTWGVYGRFILSGGIYNFFLSYGVMLFHRIIWYGAYYFLSDWLNMSNPTHSPAYYLGIYTMMQMLAVISQPSSFYIAFTYFGIRASRDLFERMLNKVFRAPMSFFDTTPNGRILNRLGSDMNEIDAGLTDKLFVTLGQLNQVVVSLIAAGIATPYLFALVPPLAIVYYYIMVYYQATARSLRRLDAGRTRSPLLQHITHTLEGMHTIKAYGLTEEWLKAFYAKVDLNQRSKRMEIILMAWMNFRLEFLGAILILGSSIFAVIARSSIPPTLAGLAVSTLMNAITFLSILVNTFSQMEIAAVHGERVFEYTELQSEAPLNQAEDTEHPEWPSDGTIKLTDYSARYRDGLPLSLKNVNAELKGGTKIAVVGRTGSGKSTLTLALFRIIEGASYISHESDENTVVSTQSCQDIEAGIPNLENVGGTISIDGVDISKLGLEKLRSAIAIIPQDATMFGGTLRTNLSPFGEHSDDQLWAALEAAGLKNHVTQNMKGALDAEILPGGTNLSKGQLQQVGLARAMLRKAKILVLDEATSSMDLETDATIQKAIRNHFSQCTVITIAHRISTILDSDTVLVMEAGSVAEHGSPKDLLFDDTSLFSKLARDTNQEEL